RAIEYQVIERVAPVLREFEQAGRIEGKDLVLRQRRGKDADGGQLTARIERDRVADCVLQQVRPVKTRRLAAPGPAEHGDAAVIRHAQIMAASIIHAEPRALAADDAGTLQLPERRLVGAAKSKL